MNDGPMIASVAALIGDPARANILTALMDGRALTVTELANAANVTIQTASGHLAKLRQAELLVGEKQGRHRYFRISAPDVAQVLEGLMSLAQRTGAVRVRTGPRDAALRTARICYDHLAGERGVELLESLEQQGFIAPDDAALTKAGWAFFAELGLDMTALEASRRPLCRHCLDWSERRNHLGGGLGAALLSKMMASGWIVRDQGRALRFTRSGYDSFVRQFSLR